MARRRTEPEQLIEVDPLQAAINTPDEPFDAEPLLVFDGRRVSWRELAEIQSGIRDRAVALND